MNGAKTYKNRRSGLSTVLSEVILVVVGITISVSAGALLIHWFSNYSQKAEGLIIYDDSYLVLDYNNNTTIAYIHIKANFKPYIIINDIKINNINYNNISIYKIITGNITISTNNKIKISDGTEVIIKVYFNINPNDIKPDIPGKKIIIIITNNGYAYKHYITIKYK